MSDILYKKVYGIDKYRNMLDNLIYILQLIQKVKYDITCNDDDPIWVRMSFGACEFSCSIYDNANIKALFDGVVKEYLAEEKS